MIGGLRRELFGHWLEEDEQPEVNTNRADLRQFLNEPGALKELANFFKSVKDVEKMEERKKAKPTRKNAKNAKKN